MYRLACAVGYFALDLLRFRLFASDRPRSLGTGSIKPVEFVSSNRLC